MELMEAIKTRRAVREYKDTPVPIEDIRFMVEAATWAPSGFNKQPWRFILIENPGLKARMVEEVEKKLFDEVCTWPGAKGMEKRLRAMLRGFTVFRGAPVAIAVLTCEYSAPLDEILLKQGVPVEERFKRRVAPGIQSVAAAIQNLLLAAASLGYGTCWGTGCLIAREGLERVLEVDPEWSLVAIVPVGIPKRRPRAPKRRSLEEVLEVR